MNTRPFVTLVVAALVLGGTIGGAFVGGVTIEKNQADEASTSNLSQPTPGSTPQGSGQLSREELDQIQQRIQSGEFTPEDGEALRGQLGQGGGGQGFAGGGGLTGTIEEIQGNTVTVNTDQGPLQVTIGAGTNIQVEGALPDLETDMQVTVIGQLGEDGIVEATSVIEGSLGGGFFGGRRQLP